MSNIMNYSTINTNLRFSLVGNISFLGAGSVIADLILRDADESDFKMNPLIMKVLAGEKIAILDIMPRVRPSSRV